MKTKFICLVSIICVVCSIFVISASAEDDILIEAGTYQFNSTLTDLQPVLADTSGQQNIPFYIDVVITLTDDILAEIQPLLAQMGFSGAVPPAGSYNVRVNSGAFYCLNSNDVYYLIGSSVCEPYNDFFTYFTYALSSNGRFNVYYNSWLDVQYRTITITQDTYVPADFGSWFNSNTSSPYDTGVLTAGSYQTTGDFLDISALSWLDSGDTVYVNVNGYVIQGFNSGTRFDQIGITYTELSANEYILSFSALRSGTNLGTFLTFTYSPMGNLVYWHLSTFPDAHGIHFNNDVVIPTDILNIFLVFFDDFAQVYTGNVWYDIIDGVVDALNVDVFGSFSPWDILTTFIGLAVFLWLLKALAGG